MALKERKRDMGEKKANYILLRAMRKEIRVSSYLGKPRKVLLQ